MRKSILVLALSLFGGFYLAAQSRPPEASIFVKPVTGNGSKSDDNNFFYKQLIQEIISQDFNLATVQKGANFTLIGSLARYMLSEKQYALHLELRDNKTGELKVDGDLLYEIAEDAKENLPVLVSSLLYTIPADIIADYKHDDFDDWRDKIVFLGIGAKWTPGIIYKGTGINGQAGFPAGIQGGFSVGFHITNFISVETGVEGQLDGVKVSGQPKPVNGIIIGVPILLKLCLKPGKNTMIEPYIGPYFNILPLGNLKPNKLSAEAGLQYSIKAGSGAVFLDVGASMELGSKVLTYTYNRINLHAGLGYKIGLIQRKEE